MAGSMPFFLFLGCENSYPFTLLVDKKRKHQEARLLTDGPVPIYFISYLLFIKSKYSVKQSLGSKHVISRPPIRAASKIYSACASKE